MTNSATSAVSNRRYKGDMPPAGGHSRKAPFVGRRTVEGVPRLGRRIATGQLKAVRPAPNMKRST